MSAMRQIWPTRWTVLGLCFAAAFVCYIDRVSISVAAIAMQEEFGWSETTKGLVLSSLLPGIFAVSNPQRLGGKPVWRALGYGCRRCLVVPMDDRNAGGGGGVVAGAPPFACGYGAGRGRDISGGILPRRALVAAFRTITFRRDRSEWHSNRDLVCAYHHGRDRGALGLAGCKPFGPTSCARWLVAVCMV